MIIGGSKGGGQRLENKNDNDGEDDDNDEDDDDDDDGDDNDDQINGFKDLWTTTAMMVMVMMMMRHGGDDSEEMTIYQLKCRQLEERDESKSRRIRKKRCSFKCHKTIGKRRLENSTLKAVHAY